jgi:serine/threonine protein kinase
MAADPARDGYIQLIEGRPDIGGRYSGQKYKGDGHFAIVFSAIDNQTQRTVAVKVFRPDRMHDPYRLDCFCREAIILEQLVGSPNILDWVGAKGEFVEHLRHDMGFSFDLIFPYFAVELATTDVATTVRSGAWDIERKLVAFRDMCKATQRIHKEGIAHRDIKPSNFLLMADGGVKLSDFGTARRIDGAVPAILQNYTIAPGDIRYNSPEMNALLHDAEPSIAKIGDIFALGATLFELCTGAILGVQLFDVRFGHDLALTMSAVHKRDRKQTYLQFLQTLDAGHPLPSVSAYAADVPPCILSLVDGLYKGMAALDYRKRISDFNTIFLKIEQCLLVLRNQEKLKRWQMQKELYKKNRYAKQLRQQSNIARTIRGE